MLIIAYGVGLYPQTSYLEFLGMSLWYGSYSALAEMFTREIPRGVAKDGEKKKTPGHVTPMQGHLDGSDRKKQRQVQEISSRLD